MTHAKVLEAALSPLLVLSIWAEEVRGGLNDLQTCLEESELLPCHVPPGLQGQVVSAFWLGDQHVQ